MTPREFNDYWKVRQQEIRTFLKQSEGRRVSSRNHRSDVANMPADEMIRHYLEGGCQDVKTSPR